jgi:hypothetical protein
VEKYGTARQTTDDNIIRRMRFACWITKATDTHSEYVILIGGFFLDEMISHKQLPLNLIFISEQPGFGFYEAIFRFFRVQEQKGLYVITGDCLLFYMCKGDTQEPQDAFIKAETCLL